MRILANLLVFFGTLGLGAVLSVSLYELMSRENIGAAVRSDGWWIEYWPYYVAAGAALLIGIVLTLRRLRG